MVWLHIHILRWEQLYWGYLFKAWYANAILESALLETIRKWLENNLIRNTTGSSAVSSRCSRVNKCSYHCRCSEIERERANAFCSPCEMKFLTGLIQVNLEKSPSAKSWWRMIETSSLSRDEEGTVCIIAGKQGGEEIEQNGLGSPPAGEDRTFLPHYRATRSTCVNESGADGKVKM